MSEMHGVSVLLVEDDAVLRAEVARNLVGHGYRVIEAGDAEDALRRWHDVRPDLVLLDLGLPDLDGIAVLRQIRRESSTGVIVLSARGEETSKPFGMPELHARMRSVLRRAAGPAADVDGVVRNGTIALDVGAHEVRVAGLPVALTPREFAIFQVLLSHPGRLVTRGRILRAVWGEAYRGEDHYVHVYVSQIRRKLAAVDAERSLDDLIIAEPGVGYRVRAPTAG